MSLPKTSVERRAFLKAGSCAIAAAAVGAVVTSPAALAQGLPPVDPKDPSAQGLGYTLDATKVDKAKFPKFAAGQNCANCQLFQGKPTDASGGCPIFPGKSVSAKAWCSAYVKKA
jgi:hypothetical protein